VKLPFQAGNGRVLVGLEPLGKLIAQPHEHVAFPFKRRDAPEGGSMLGAQGRKDCPVDASVADCREHLTLADRRPDPLRRPRNLAVDRRVYDGKVCIDGPIQAGESRQARQQDDGRKHQEQNADRDARDAMVQDIHERP
jgi:hypothetical protein